MVSLLSFNTKKRRTSKSRAVEGSGDKGVSRAGRKQEGEAQECPHAFARLEEDATYHCAGRQAIEPKPEK
jgi:hypothetical protein